MWLERARELSPADVRDFYPNEFFCHRFSHFHKPETVWDGLCEELPALRLLSPAVATQLGFPFFLRDDEQALEERILAFPTRSSARDKSDVLVDADVVVSDTFLPYRYPEASPGYIAANQRLTGFGYLLLDREVVAVDSKAALGDSARGAGLGRADLWIRETERELTTRHAGWFCPWALPPYSLVAEAERSRWFVPVPEWWETFEAPRFL